MPELPEVENIVRYLNKTIIGFKITGAWTDWPKIVKNLSFDKFNKKITNRKILRIQRRAKYILIDLTGNKTLLLHQKISGHLLFGKWEKNKEGKWQSIAPGPLKDDPKNQFIRFILFSSSGKMLALSDLRRFAKILLFDKDKIEELGEIKSLGPEPLAKNFTFKKFHEILKNKKGKIKQVLMDQNIIAGIGNIYSDEILWEAKIHPLKETKILKEKELKGVFSAIKKILKKAIKFQGDSIDNYRLPDGKKGKYQEIQKVYQREGKKCFRCKALIKRIKIGGRSAHFCPECQTLTRHL